jgi:hypothetical protein
MDATTVGNDLGHQGDFDYTQIEAFLRLTPEQRLDQHEGWRLFVKEALENARIRQRRLREANGGER